MAIIYISHRLSEVRDIADRVVCLRDGKVAGHLARAEISQDAMVRLMIGRDLAQLYTAPQAAPGSPVLQLKGLTTAAFPDRTIDLALRRGEILGLAGLIGAGRTSLAKALFGIDPSLAGEILLEGAEVVIRNPSDAIGLGLYLVPEDRKRSALVLDMTIRENVSLADVARFARRGWVQREAEGVTARQELKRLKIKASGIETPVVTLSGGNQQKVVLAKWLSMRPRLIVFDEPTRGIDVGAKAEIYALMRGLADEGVGILMISSDLEEVLGVSDRITVMHEGRISGTLDRAAFSEEAVMHLAVGLVEQETAA